MPKHPVEKKVTAATGWAGAGTAGTYSILSLIADNPNIIDGVPADVEALIVGIAAAVLTFIGGYLAPHTSHKTEK